MNKIEEIKNIIFENGKLNASKVTEKYFKTNHNYYYNLIDNQYNGIKFNQKLSLYIKGVFSIPICKNCEKTCKFDNFLTGFTTFCSKKCSNIYNANYNKLNGIKHDNNKPKAEKTKLDRYGDKNWNNREKAFETMIEKYGAKTSGESKLIFDKMKATNLVKYNVEYITELPAIQNKIKTTLQDRYGVSSSWLINNDSVKKNNTKKINFEKKYSENYDIFVKEDSDILISNYCDIHKTFSIDKLNFYSRKRKQISLCTECYPINDSSSIIQQMLYDFFSKKFNLKSNIKLLGNKEIDVYFCDYNIGLEVNGEYYHSTLFKEKDYHYKKMIESKSLGIKLLFFWESDLKNKFDIITSIIRSKLNSHEEIIYARKCLVKEVDYNTSLDFLNRNHLQGNSVSKYRYGLYYNDELVSIITFGNLRLNLNTKPKKDSYELLRFCNKLNTKVIGGASKLLRYFEKQINPKEIITYANCEISDGELYQKIGFEEVKQKVYLNYFWYKNGTKYNRFNFTKQKLVNMGFNKEKTENEIMLENGYIKIYGCGNLKFIKKYA
jgi:hypothetical protein